MTKRVSTDPGIGDAPAPASGISTASRGDTEPTGAPVVAARDPALAARDAALDALGGRPRVFVDERANSDGASGAVYYAKAHPAAPVRDVATIPDAKIILEVTPAPAQETTQPLPGAPPVVLPLHPSGRSGPLFDGATAPPQGEARTRRALSRLQTAVVALSLLGTLVLVVTIAVLHRRSVDAPTPTTSATAGSTSSAPSASSTPTTPSSMSAGPSASAPPPRAPSPTNPSSAPARSATMPPPTPSAPSPASARPPAPPASSASGGIRWNFDEP